MKKLISILFIATLGLISCKKESKEENKEETIAEKLIGVWEAQKELEIEYQNGIEVDREENAVPPGELIFAFDGTTFSNTYKNFTSNDKYIVSGNIIDYSSDGSAETDIYIIKSISKTQLLLSEERTTVGHNIIYKDFFEYTFIKRQ